MRFITLPTLPCRYKVLDRVAQAQGQVSMSVKVARALVPRITPLGSRVSISAHTGMLHT